MTDQDMEKLVKLDPADFDPKEYAALAWARDWALFRGEFPDQEVVSEFEKSYTEEQRNDILAVVTIMDFANRFNNTVTGQVLYDPAERLQKHENR